MEISSAQKVCQNLICSAIQRCRISDDLCRLSVVIKCSSVSDPQIVRISISDTGVGSCLEEFQDLNYTRNCVSAEKWDGVLSVTTTSICVNEIYHYNLNLKQNVAARRLTSGTEVSLSTYESMDDLIAGITRFFQKMLILKIPNLDFEGSSVSSAFMSHGCESCDHSEASYSVHMKVAVELLVERADSPASRSENLLNDGILLPFPMSNIERLSSGLEDYVLKHGNSLDKECRACFSSREHLKVGSGVACCTENLRNTEHVVEAVIIISELPESSSPSCLGACGTATKVIYFYDFSPCSIPQSSLKALTSIKWKSYGLTLRASVADRDGSAILEWENLLPHAHIDIALHSQQKTQVDRNLVKKAVKLALDDLKERYTGILLSAHALKICNFAPDLAKTIAGLILSSNDLGFQGECFSLLGVHSQEIGEEKVVDCIREKIIATSNMKMKKSNACTNSLHLLKCDIYEQAMQVLSTGCISLLALQ
ncbi:hypothetical protein HHK36_024953 [Tetracentron sinense]|uniref:Type 2 DNA topoisomerase 6 subunit B-like n=1 Tax=Tetracentron sinense TaxID=13715 RepID=A0A834YQY4_TETSI|nr:hypothetical protein HHK36_024953 [Tetracentron sinense]